MENPWGEPSPPLALARTTSTESTLEPEQRRSVEFAQDDDDAPAWDADDSSIGHKSNDSGDDDDDDWAREARAANLTRLNQQEQLERDDQQPENGADRGSEEPSQTEATTRDDDDAAQSVPSADEEPRLSTQLPPPVPMISAALPSFDADAGQQMDDFPEDDEPLDARATTAPPATAGFTEGDDAFADDDDFDDFDEPAAEGGAGGDDDFGDFGDFGDAAPLDEAAFESTPLPSSALDATPTPFASTSTASSASYPPLRFELGDRSRQAISSQLHDFWEGAFPAAARAVNDEPERQVEGLAQILVSESSYVSHIRPI